MKSLIVLFFAGYSGWGMGPIPASGEPLESAYQQAQQDTQKPADAPPAEIEAAGLMNVRETILRVSVTDKDGNYYKDLEKEDFAIKINKKDHPINFFTYRENAVSFAFVFDVTGSMSQTYQTKMGTKTSNFGLARQIIAYMMKSPLAKDEFILSLVRDQEPRVIIPEFTRDISQVEDAMNQQKPEGRTPLYETLLQTMQAISKAHAHNEKKAMIVVTDGEENHSKGDSFKKLKQLTPELDTQVFIIIVPGTKRKYQIVCKDSRGAAIPASMNSSTIDDAEGKASLEIQAAKICSNARANTSGQTSTGSGIPNGGPGNRGNNGIPMELPDDSGPAMSSTGGGCAGSTASLARNNLFDLCDLGPEGLMDAREYAESTGGLTFDTTNKEQFLGAFTAIYTHLRMQYMLGFEPKGVKKGFNQVKISVKNPQKNGPDLTPHVVKQIYYDSKF